LIIYYLYIYLYLLSQFRSCHDRWRTFVTSTPYEMNVITLLVT